MSLYVQAALVHYTSVIGKTHQSLENKIYVDHGCDISPVLKMSIKRLVLFLALLSIVTGKVMLHCYNTTSERVFICSLARVKTES